MSSPAMERYVDIKVECTRDALASFKRGHIPALCAIPENINEFAMHISCSHAHPTSEFSLSCPTAQHRDVSQLPATVPLRSSRLTMFRLSCRTVRATLRTHRPGWALEPGVSHGQSSSSASYPCLHGHNRCTFSRKRQQTGCIGRDH